MPCFVSTVSFESRWQCRFDQPCVMWAKSSCSVSRVLVQMRARDAIPWTALMGIVSVGSVSSVHCAPRMTLEMILEEIVEVIVNRHHDYRLHVFVSDNVKHRQSTEF